MTDTERHKLLSKIYGIKLILLRTTEAEWMFKDKRRFCIDLINAIISELERSSGTTKSCSTWMDAYNQEIIQFGPKGLFKTKK